MCVSMHVMCVCVCRVCGGVRVRGQLWGGVNSSFLPIEASARSVLSSLLQASWPADFLTILMSATAVSSQGHWITDM